MQNSFLTGSGESDCRNLPLQAFVLKMGKLRPRTGKPEVTSRVGARIRLELSRLSPNSFLPHHKAAFQKAICQYLVKTEGIEISRVCAQGEKYIYCRTICHQKKGINNLGIPH